MLGVTLLLVVVAIAIFRVRFAAFDGAGAVAIDYRTFVEDGHRFLATGSPYLPYQLSGPYEAAPPNFRQPPDVPFLYPPPFALVTVALTVLPAFIWWVVPLAGLAWLVADWRPAPWAWPLVALALVWPTTSAVVIVGGSTLWVTALVGGGLRYGWPAVFIVLKPTFGLFALIGIGSRSWLVAVAVVLGVSVAMLPLWSQYVSALGNAMDLSAWYSVGDLPTVLLPVVAWAGRTRDQGKPNGGA